MRYLSAHAQHIGARRYQQDAFELAEYDPTFREHGGILAVVCDGMGGMQHGDLASQAAISTLIAEYGRKAQAESIPEALLRSVQAANKRVVTVAEGMGVEGSMGTTLIATAILNGQYHYISVGDSAIFHVRDQKLQLVNQPHVFGNLLDRAVETGTLTQDEANAHPEREALTSFVGISNLQEIDRSDEPRAYGTGDTLLLATDGLFKTLETSEIEAELAGHPQDWPSRLIAATLNKRSRGQDNITVLTVTDDTAGIGPKVARTDQSQVTVEISQAELEEHLRRRAAQQKPPAPPADVPSDARSADAPAGESASAEKTQNARISRGLFLGGIVALALLAVAFALLGYKMGRAG
ncbi:MAG: protein phosphatase 2C domain-containing protein [Bryobacteraceae bacterium]